MSGSPSVAIIGGGVIGLCTAWYALERGWRVTVVERNACSEHGGPESGCSLGNAGMIVPSHFIPLAAPGMVGMGIKMMRDKRSPFYIQPRPTRDLLEWGLRFVRSANATHVENSAPILRDMGLQSRSLYEELETQLDTPRDSNPGFGLTKRGLLMLCKTQHALDEEAHVAKTANALGMPANVLSPQEAAQIDPDVRMDVVGAVHYPLDCHLSPDQFVAKLARALELRGADLRFNTEVKGWKINSNRVQALQTTKGEEIVADEYVVSGGAWSPTITRGLNIRLPMQAGKGYSLTLRNPPETPRLCSILVEARVAVTPMGNTVRFGGTMEIAGMDETIRPYRVEGITNAAQRYFPAFKASDFANVPVWAGLRPCSPDGMPYVGRFACWANVTAATGHAMMGLSLGPVTGKLVTQVLAGEAPAIGLAMLSPDRFQ